MEKEDPAPKIKTKLCDAKKQRCEKKVHPIISARVTLSKSSTVAFNRRAVAPMNRIDRGNKGRAVVPHAGKFRSDLLVGNRTHRKKPRSGKKEGVKTRDKM